MYLKCAYCGARKRDDKIETHVKACMKKRGIRGEPRPPEPLRDDESRREDETHDQASQFADNDVSSSINISEIM